MPTFGDWERTVLEHAYEHVDYVSCHAYYQELDGDLRSFLASALDMDFFIDAVAATADHVGRKKRSKKKMQISFDEWNVWYLKEHQEATGARDEWTHAPRLLEDVYTVADAVVVGNLLGAEQHGHMVTVGFDYYTQMLEEAIAEAQSGQTVEAPPEPTTVDLHVSAFLPEDYLGLLNPLWSTAEPRGRVEAVRHEAPGAATLLIRPGTAWRGHRPGQWVKIGVDIGGVRHWRTFSLSSPPRPDGRITITVKAGRDGFVSAHLVHRIRPGAIVRLGEADRELVRTGEALSHVERALYILEGEAQLDGVDIPARHLVLPDPGTRPKLRAKTPLKVMLLGGEPLDGHRHLWWNFVSSSKERIEQAKQDWLDGRFGRIEGDDEFIPLPQR